MSKIFVKSFILDNILMLSFKTRTFENFFLYVLFFLCMNINLKLLNENILLKIKNVINNHNHNNNNNNVATIDWF